jgi:hypothetical protein
VTPPVVDAARGSQPAGGASRATSLTGMTSGHGARGWWLPREGDGRGCRFRAGDAGKKLSGRRAHAPSRAHPCASPLLADRTSVLRDEGAWLRDAWLSRSASAIPRLPHIDQLPR